MNTFKFTAFALPLTLIALTFGLSGCNAKPTVYQVEATQGFCDAGFNAWDKPVCSGEMKDAGVIAFTLDTTTSQVTSSLIKPNPFAQRELLDTFNQCQITDALNWSCEVKDQHFIKVKQGHYHYYTLNQDLTLSHFIGQVTEQPNTSK